MLSAAARVAARGAVSAATTHAIVTEGRAMVLLLVRCPRRSAQYANRSPDPNFVLRLDRTDVRHHMCRPGQSGCATDTAVSVDGMERETLIRTFPMTRVSPFR